MPIIILEGTEKTGKTPFYNYLIKRAENIFPLESVLLKKKRMDLNTLFKNTMIQHIILEFLSERFPNYFFAIDRSIPTSLVYDEFFNRGANPYVSSENILKNMIAKNTLFIIFLRFKNKRILETKINEYPDELLKDSNEIWAVQEAFEVLFSKLIPSNLIFTIEIKKKIFIKKDFDFYYKKLNEKLLNVFNGGLE